MTNAKPKRRKTDHAPPAPVAVPAVRPEPPPVGRRAPITVIEVRAYAELLTEPRDLVAFILDKHGQERRQRFAAREALRRYAQALPSPQSIPVLEALASHEHRSPGPQRRETLAVTSNGRVIVNARTLAPPGGRVRIDHREIDGQLAIVLFKARRATDAGA